MKSIWTVLVFGLGLILATVSSASSFTPASEIQYTTPIATHSNADR